MIERGAILFSLQGASVEHWSSFQVVSGWKWSDSKTLPVFHVECRAPGACWNVQRAAGWDISFALLFLFLGNTTIFHYALSSKNWLMNWVTARHLSFFPCVILSHVSVKECHAPCNGKIPLQGTEGFLIQTKPSSVLGFSKADPSCKAQNKVWSLQRSSIRKGNDWWWKTQTIWYKEHEKKERSCCCYCCSFKLKCCISQSLRTW